MRRACSSGIPYMSMEVSSMAVIPINKFDSNQFMSGSRFLDHSFLEYVFLQKVSMKLRFAGILLNQKRQTNMDNGPVGNSEKQSGLKQCPYISTIRKNMLDFDFEKICSISLAHTNVYACLVCGRYFQGRSSTSPAYQHSIEFSHYIFMNLQNSRVYCIPDDYEVDSYTINDVKFNLKPVYTLELLNKLQKMEDIQYNVDGKEYYPGVMGLNNLGKTDFASVAIYMLNAVTQVRKFFTLAGDFDNQLVNEFGTLLKKIWNPKSFKGLVSPHQFLQAITEASGKKFKIGCHSEPYTFFLWLIDNLNRGIKKQKGIKFDIQKLFRGKLKTSIIKGIKDSYEYEEIPTKIEEVQFSILKFEFPEQGVFNKTQSQISLDVLLQKYTGKVGQKHELGLRYGKIMEFPQYLVLVFKRFASNGYSVQKDNSHLLYSLKLNITSNNCTGYYKLLSQVCHSGDYENGKYKIIINMEEAEKWFEIEDLDVKEIIQKQVLLAQPIMQVYRLIKLEQKVKESF